MARLLPHPGQRCLVFPAATSDSQHVLGSTVSTRPGVAAVLVWVGGVSAVAAAAAAVIVAVATTPSNAGTTTALPVVFDAAASSSFGSKLGRSIRLWYAATMARNQSSNCSKLVVLS